MSFMRRLDKVGAAEPDSEIVSTATDMLNDVQATLELVRLACKGQSSC